MSKTLSLRPKLSEKTYSLSEARVYVVEVPKDANKHLVAHSIEEQFEVKVSSVNMTNIRGKKKRTRSLDGKRYTNVYGKRNDIKKAYVTLQKGHSLPFFAAIEEEEEQQEKTQQNIDKAIAKQSAKEAKPARRGLRLRKSSDSTEQEEEK